MEKLYAALNFPAVIDPFTSEFGATYQFESTEEPNEFGGSGTIAKPLAAPMLQRCRVQHHDPLRDPHDLDLSLPAEEHGVRRILLILQMQPVFKPVALHANYCRCQAEQQTCR